MDDEVAIISFPADEEGADEVPEFTVVVDITDCVSTELPWPEDEAVCELLTVVVSGLEREELCIVTDDDAPALDDAEDTWLNLDVSVS